MRENKRPISRESFWSIPSGWRVAYVLTFAVKIIAYTILVARYEIVHGGHSSATEIIIAVAERDSLVIPGFVASTAIMMEGVSYIVITAEYFRNKFIKPIIEQHKEEGRAEGRAEGLTEGLTEMYQKWTDWNNRRMEAEREGLPFDEPPPDAAGRQKSVSKSATYAMVMNYDCQYIVKIT